MSSRLFSISHHEQEHIEFPSARRPVPISRFYFVAAFLSVAMITGVCMVIAGRPANDQSIRTFLAAPDGCAAPCFMGVRLGVTLGADAQTIMAAHPWVEAGSIYVAEDTTRHFMWMSWRWSAASPSFLTGTGYMTYSPQEGDGRIRDIQIRTTLPFGAVWLALGMPDAGSVGLEHVARYSDRWLFAETRLGCGHFWERPTEFYMVAPNSLVTTSDLLHVQPYEAVLRMRGCLGQTKR